MANTVNLKWQGLDDLREQLRNLPKELTREAGTIVIGAGQAAHMDVRAAYNAHTWSGNLAGGLVFEQLAGSGSYGVSFRLQSRAKHAWIFENGTEARHYVTVNGRKKDVGRMPPFNAFLPPVIRERRRMYEALKKLIETFGFKVTGDVAA